MSILSPTDMMEATRLTREGRLADAMAILRGRHAGSVTPETPRRPGKSSAPAGEPSAPLVIDATFDRIGTPPAHPRRRAPTQPARVGGRFETHSHAGAAGRRDYKLYVPADLGTQAVPLIVMLHGCTQSPDDFAAGTRMNALADAHGFLVAYPAQSRAANASGCWNWFKAGDQRRDGGEPALIAGIARAIITAHPVDPARVYVAGLSAGGAAAAIMGSRYPDLFAAIGVHSGLACGAARDMASALSAMQRGGTPAGTVSTAGLPTIVFHGDRDTTVHPRNGDQVIAQSKGGGTFTTAETRGRSPGGTRYTTTIHSDRDGKAMLEHWALEGVGHAWSGGSSAGTYTYPPGPDASAEMLRFFRNHARVTKN